MRSGRRLRIAMLAVLVAVPLAGISTTLTARVAGAAITKYTDPGIRFANSITAGPDGALWFTNDSSIGRITTSGEVSTFSGDGTLVPIRITKGPDGALWFTDAANRIGRITTAGVVKTFTGNGISHPLDITTGPDGALWFTNNGINDKGHTVGRITTAGKVTFYTDPSISGPYGITSGPDGAVWFTNVNNDTIGRITTAGVVTHFTDPVKVGIPRGITTGPDGALWFVVFNGISRITTKGVISQPFLDLETPHAEVITTGPDGNLWFNNASDSEIERLTPAGVVTRFAGGNVEYPYGIAAGPDGAMWFTNTLWIGRIDVSTPPTAVPDAPTNVVATAGNGYAKVTFTTPAYDGGSVIMGYNTTCTSSNGGATRSMPGAPGPIVVSGLTNGSDYSCAVTARNVIGTSLPSTPSNSFAPSAPAGTPHAPTIDLAAPHSGSVTLNFTPGSSAGPILGYSAACAPLFTVPWKTMPASAYASGATSPIEVTGLENQQLYTCTMFATNALGSSPLSEPSKKFEPSDNGSPPSPPRNPSAVAGNGRAIVSWTAPASAANSFVWDYVVTRYVNGVAGGPKTFYELRGNRMSVTFGNLINGRTYRFKVAAENSYGTSPQSVYTNAITPGIPDAARAVKAVSVGKGVLKVSFNAPADYGAPITSYTVACTSTNGGAKRSKAGKAGPIVVSGLTAGKAYRCTVIATNSRGPGPPSHPSATTPA